LASYFIVVISILRTFINFLFSLWVIWQIQQWQQILNAA